MPAWPNDLTLTADARQMYDNDGGDATVSLGRVRYPGTVNAVEFIPNWSMNGADTNSRTYTLYNRGSAGAGTTAIATLALVSGVNLSESVVKIIPVTAANAVVAVDDVLQWESLHVGTGLPDPGGQVTVKMAMTF